MDSLIDSSNIDTSGQIIFKIINSGEPDISFVVTLNIDISDTIYPIINFYSDVNNNATYTFSPSRTSFRGDDGSNIFYTHIMIDQSEISNNPTRDLIPTAQAYDQVTNVVTESIDVDV